ncbi:hypothetical protein KP509_14G025400 [Ceratopteris richardii]|nr:hypothetical protein KP509_14G025400 [Ceratopteris richardii]
MLAYRRSVFLVNFTQDGNTYNIHLDIPDVMWTNLLDSYNIAIISTGYWYFRSSVYYLNNTTVGTSSSFGLNTSVYAIYPAMQIAWDTVLRYMLKEFKGITVMRTITVPHFESSSWYNGGNCNKTQPFFDPLMKEPLPWANERMTRVQTQAFKKAMDYINENSMDPKKLLLLNITYSSFLRPDGHPGAYRIQKPDEPRNDCLHWCLPGVIDMWNEILLELLLGTSV